MRNIFAYALILLLPSANLFATSAILPMPKSLVESAPAPTKLLLNSTDLNFAVQHDNVEELIYRRGPIACHVYIDTAKSPYLFFAFPAGNSGVGLWFVTSSTSVTLNATSQPKPAQREKGLFGVEVDIKATTQSLSISDAVLGNMRFIRDRELNMKVPEAVLKNEVQIIANKATLKRASLNGKAEYVIEIQPIGDTEISKGDKGQVHFDSATEVEFKMTGMTSEPPVTAMAPSTVFKDAIIGNIDPRKLEAFSFLLYKEKLTAGSPRYLSRFGRDSVITLNVLMDSMKPEAVELLLSSTLSGSHPIDGTISHEENEGDFVSHEKMTKGEKYIGITDPAEDYRMVDSDFLFTIAMTNYMQKYPERVKNFMTKQDLRGLSLRQLTLNNFRSIIRQTEAFANAPVFSNLVHLKDDNPYGNWRDSNDGLAHGYYPFDVNAALAPGALKGLVFAFKDPRTGFADPKIAKQMQTAFEVWNTKAPPFFEVRIPPKEVEAAGTRYLKALNYDPAKFPAPTEEFVFPALSLDKAGKPIPIMHSDDSFMMEFGYPSASYLRSVKRSDHFLTDSTPRLAFWWRIRFLPIKASTPCSTIRNITAAFHGACKKTYWFWALSANSSGPIYPPI
jgi:hypothetical protein